MATLTPEQRAKMAMHIKAGKSPREALKAATSGVEIGPVSGIGVSVGKPVVEAARPDPKITVGEVTSEPSVTVGEPMFAKGGVAKPSFAVQGADTQFATPEAAKQDATNQLLTSQNPFEYMRLTHAEPGQGLQLNSAHKVMNFAPETVTAKPAQSAMKRVHAARHAAQQAMALPTPMPMAPAPIDAGSETIRQAQAGQAASLPSFAPELPGKVEASAPIADDSRFAHGGKVACSSPAEFHNHMAQAVQGALHAHVQRYAFGTPNGGATQLTPQEQLEFDQAGHNSAQNDMADMPQANLPVPHSRELNADEQSEHAALAVKAGHSMNGEAESTRSLDKAPRDRLDEIEAARVARNEAGRPGVGGIIGRSLANGLIGLGRGQQIDFDKADREFEAGNNSEADRLTKNYLGRPGAEAARNASIAGSEQSKNSANLIGQLTGINVGNMSADEQDKAKGLLAGYLQAKQSDKALTLQSYIAQQKNTLEGQKLGLEGRKLGEASRHNGVEEGIGQQNADARKNAAALEGSKLQQTNDRALQTEMTSNRGDTGAQQASVTMLAGQKFLTLPDNPTTEQVNLAAAELAKAANGGPDQNLANELASPTLQGKVAEAARKLGLGPQDAGYGKIMMQVYKPYIREIMKASNNTLRQSVARKHAIAKARPGGTYSDGFLDNVSPEKLYPDTVEGASPAANPLTALGGKLDDEE